MASSSASSSAKRRMRITPIGLAPPQLPQEQTEQALGQPPAARAGAAMAGWSGVDAALAVQRRIDDIKEDPDDPDALRKACQGYGTVLAPRAEAHGTSADYIRVSNVQLAPILASDVPESVSLRLSSPRRKQLKRLHAEIAAAASTTAASRGSRVVALCKKCKQSYTWNPPAKLGKDGLRRVPQPTGRAPKSKTSAATEKECAECGVVQVLLRRRRRKRVT